MKICYFGLYEPDYSRNKIFIQGLRQNGVEVLECRSEKTGLSKYLDLIKKHRLVKGSYDVMMVGYPGFQAMFLAKFLTNKPIIFNAFVSLYDSMVQDRKQVSRFSLRALYYWLLDKLALSFSGISIFDTNQHIKYVAHTFGVKPGKLRRVFLGADTAVFFPRENTLEDKVFRVVFYGHYIPLQGVEYIIQSAKILENHKDIVFDIIGDGQEKANMMKLKNSLNLNNINFFENMPLDVLADKVALADVCLGIFGNTEKTQRVIPNKVYECVAMQKPVITADTPAIRELFSEDELFLVSTSNPKQIAEAILRVNSDRREAGLFANRAYNKLTKTALSEQIGLELKNIIKELLLTGI